MCAKKTVSVVLVLLLTFGLAAPAMAAAPAGGEQTLTRGDFIAALYRLNGAGNVEAKQESFSDVPAEGELAQAVRWAADNKIVSGYGGGKFGPDDVLTREQLAVMLYRNAQALGQGFQGAWMFRLDYPDAERISDWADEAMHWVVMHEILPAAGQGLEPKAAVAAAELAEILVRWEAAVGKQEAAGINYLALVNKVTPLPEGWEDALETVHVTNSVGDDVEVEKKAYDAYLLLKADLAEHDGIELELDSARRSVAAQQEIMERYIEKYGADYAAKTVATPGYSEHHTGLALDLYFRLDGKDVYYNEDLVQHPEIWEKIHAKLADYGFILRYLAGKEHITGYGYEPWHIRYVDDAAIAEEIMSNPGMTLEVYLGAAADPDVSIDYGSSELYSREALDEAIMQIKCRFASFAGCELHSLRYAGDACNSEENIRWMNELDAGKNYVQAVEFLSDFHSPREGGGAWETDQEYQDWQWWLARTEEGGWQLLTWGY